MLTILNLGIILVLLIMIAIWATYGFFSAFIQLILVIASGVLALALWDFFQHRHTLRRNYPLVARIRWLMEDLRPYARAYVVEGDLEGRPFNHDERALVYARSKGELDSHPFGTELDVYSDEYEWLGHSIVPNEQAPADWRIDVGSSQCSRPYSASLLNISAMSFGSLSANAVLALNKGAAMTENQTIALFVHFKEFERQEVCNQLFFRFPCTDVGSRDEAAKAFHPHESTTTIGGEHF